MVDQIDECRTALVTGGAGFIGSHLCERLISEDYNVISLDNYFSGSIQNHVRGVEYRAGHTKDIEFHVPETPGIVYHLGEYSRVEKSLEEWPVVRELNDTGTFSVLEFCKKRNVKIVYAGSSTKFALDPEHSATPYSYTKTKNAELVAHYGKWFGLPFAITYFYNVYGGREIASGPYATLIAIFRQQMYSGQPLTVVLPGTQKRQFTHVDDIIDGLVLIGEGGSGDGYAIGSNREYTILEVADLFGGNVRFLPPRQGNRMASSIDTSKTEALGWKPKKKLEEYIQSICAEANASVVPSV